MSRAVRVIRVPYDSGHENWRMGGGPGVLAGTDLLDALPANTVVRDVTLGSETRYEMATTLALHDAVANEIRAARSANDLPVVFSGNCNVPAIGAVAAIERALGCIWFDAHGDFNTTETSPSGFTDGMALSMVTGDVWQRALESVSGFSPVDPRNVVLVGARDLDPEEEERLRGSDLRWLPPDELHAVGEALDALAGRTDAIYLHLDLDVLDPGELVTNEYAAPSGLTVDQLLAIVEQIVRRFRVEAVGIAAYDPARDEAGRGPDIVRAIVTRLVAEP